MNFLDNLNPEQREAVLHTEGPLLILAGAGSGRRASSRLASRTSSATGTPRPDEVLAVTFTNKAAERDARPRRAAAGRRLPADVWLSTFHSLCARLLRREAPAIGLSRDFVIYDSSDQLAVVKQALRELRYRRQDGPAAAGAHRASARRRTAWKGPRRCAAAWNLRDEQIAKIYENYVAP